MKQPPSEPSILTRQPALKIFVFEFTGTLLLTYGVVCSDIDSAPTDFFIACSLFLAISWCGEFTRAHVNPAVSLGIWISQRYPLIISYVLAQILGGFIGSMLAYAVTETSISPMKETNFSDAITYGIREFAGTFMFVSLILMVTCRSTTFVKKKLYVYVFIPMALFISREYSGGTGLNPAVTFMSQLTNCIVKGGSMDYTYMLIIGPLLGGTLAGFFFKRVLQPLCAVAKYQLKYKMK